MEGVVLHGYRYFRAFLVLNRVYNFYVSVLSRVCILSFILSLKQGPKMKGVVLHMHRV